MEPFKHTNRLEKEASPYLLQHAHNPVDWFPWGEEAFAKAKAENKPVFLSVGYSACHWCHVMAHESFENEEIAQLVNKLFVNIKVDREERPDVDSVYMQSVVMLTGHGGWPLSVFLTPDLKPYWGGTYFPPKAKYDRPGFPEILQQVHDMYAGQTEKTRSRAEKILEKMQSSLQVGLPGNTPGAQLIDEAINIQSEKYDESQGGFGTGMKFPEPMAYTLLLRHWLRTGSSKSMEMLDKSLTKMASGGMYDQLGGGFHRYSTDREWRVPHFEKMLYDNALMAKLYLDVYQATKQDIYKEIPAGIFSYISREMTSPEGGFYSTQDADSEGKEGTFFLWSLKEVLELLGPKHAKVFAKAFAITPAGDLDGKNVLRINGTMEKIAEEAGVAIFEADHIIKNGKQVLFEAREKREKPGRDEKIITSWNGLMITAFATGYAVLRDKTYLEAAERCANFICNEMWRDGRLLRIFKDGRKSIDGFLEDYAYFLESLIALYEASFDLVWVKRALELADQMIAQFWDASVGGFFMAGSNQEKLVHRPKNPADEAIPSANSVAALALLKLGHLTGKNEYIKKGEDTLSAFHSIIERRPPAYAGLLSAIDFQLKPPVEIVFSGPREDPRFEEMVQKAHQDYRPNKILMHSQGEETGQWLPLTQGKATLQGEPTVHLCQNQTCHPPVQSAKALENLLERPPMIEINIFDEDKKLEETRTEQNQNFLNVMDNIFKHSGLGKKDP